MPKPHYKMSVKEREDYYKRKSAEKEYLSKKYKKYLLSDGQYYKLAKMQDYKCAICNNPETGKSVKGKLISLSIDHCHASGKVRQLLCRKCNTGLGMFNDNLELFNKAIKYLQYHKGVLNIGEEAYGTFIKF